LTTYWLISLSFSLLRHTSKLSKDPQHAKFAEANQVVANKIRDFVNEGHENLAAAREIELLGRLGLTKREDSSISRMVMLNV